VGQPVSFLLILLFLAAPSLAQQQSRLLKAAVVDRNTNTPLPYANVFNKRLATDTVTNQKGYFGLKDDLNSHHQIKCSTMLKTPKKARINTRLGTLIAFYGYILRIFKLINRQAPNILDQHLGAK
jgi:hypothetical protein